jgi:arylsulfatase A-like enzyme
MIHTGRSLYRIEFSPGGAITNGGKTMAERQGQTPLPARTPWGHITNGVETMAETFRKAGYRTFATGKQHNGPQIVASGFTDAGNLLFAGGGQHMRLKVHDFDPSGRYAPEDGKVVPQYSSEIFTGAALDFLDRDRAGDPFFMYLAYTVPHDPIMAPPKFMSLYPPDKIRLHPTFQPAHPFDVSRIGDRVRPMQSCDECEADAVIKFHEWPIEESDMQSLVAGYYAMLTHLDDQIGRIRARLEELGEWQNTIIVFASDNGIAMGRHGCYHKQTSYDHDAHVPLILCGPGLAKGESRNAMVYLYDLYPTLCDLAGIPVPDSVEGKSFVPVLRGDESAGRDVLYHAYVNDWRAVYDGRYRLLLYAGYDEANDVIVRRRMLFDVQADPMETRDLAGDPAHATEVARLESLLIELRDQYADPMVPDGFWERYTGNPPDGE